MSEASSHTQQCPRCGLSLSLVGTQTSPLPEEPATEWVAPPSQTHLPGARAPESAAQRVGRFEVRRLLGEGAFGRVYEAYDPSLKRSVALKVARAEHCAEPRRLERFLREARAAGVLMHPHIVAVFDSGTDGPRAYIASSFVPGKSLDAALDERGPLPPREAAQIARKLAEALAYAHKQGVIHRDVKPSNVMLRQDGEPMLMDFGLAARADEDAKLTVAGQFMGTPAYSAPEQWRGEACSASDQYALGCVLFELLTGKKPYRGRDLGHYLSLHTESPIPGLPGAPRDLQTIVRKCLEKSPAQRYADCEALAEDLRRWLAGEPIRARRVGPIERLGRWARREPGTAALVSAVAVLLVAGTAAAWGLAGWALSEKGRAENNAEQVKAKEEEANRQKTTALAQKARADREAKLANERKALAEEEKKVAQYQALRAEHARHAIQIDLALRAWEQHDVARAEEVLGEMAPPFQQAWETGYLRALCRRKAMPLVGHTHGVGCVAYSPDGKRVATGSNDNTVRIWDAQTGQEKLRLRGHEGAIAISCLAFSPDGKRLAVGSWRSTVQVHDAQTGKHGRQFKFKELEEIRKTRKGIVVVKGGGITVTCVAFSPDGKRIAAGGPDDGTVLVWDAQTGQKKFQFAGNKADAPNARVDRLAFSPDGKRIATGSLQMLKVWDAEKGEVKHALKGHRHDIQALAFSLDGKRLLSGCGNNTIRVWDVETGQEKLQLKGNLDLVLSMAVSRDGKWIASGGWDKTIRLWSAQTGQEKVTLKGHTGPVACLAFSPDGKRLTSGGKHARMWNVDMGPGPTFLKGPPLAVSSLAVSPDSKRIAVGGQAGAAVVVKVVSARTGEEVFQLPGHDRTQVGLAFSPDGQWIATGCKGDTLRLWDAQTGKEKRTFLGHKAVVLRVAFSPDSKQIASASMDRTVRVWDVETGQRLRRLEGHTKGAYDVAFSPDGKWIVSTSIDGALRLWEAETGKQFRRLTGPTNGGCVAFSPDSKHVATGSDGRMLRVWDVGTGREAFTLKGHTSTISSMAFSPDGKRIVTGSLDRTVRVWDTQTGQEKIQLQGHTKEVMAVAFSPDGEWIVSGSRDGTVRVWGAVR